MPTSINDLARIVAVLRNPGYRIEFQPEDFEVVIIQHGNNLLWEKGTLCACRNNNQGESPLVDCPVCYGEGWEYWGAQVIRGIFLALDLDKDTQMAYGMWTTGRAQVTVRHEHAPGFRDRYTNLDSLLRFDEKRERRAVGGGLEQLRYHIGVRPVEVYEPEPDSTPTNVTDPATIGAFLRLADEKTRERNQPFDGQQMVLRMRLMDPTTREPGRVLVEGVDFEVVDGRISWAKGDARGTAPAVGQLFTVSYNYHPRYVITSFNHAYRNHWLLDGRPFEELRRMPIEILAQLDYLRPKDGA